MGGLTELHLEQARERVVRIGERFLFEWEFGGAPDLVLLFRVQSIFDAFIKDFELRTGLTLEDVELISSVDWVGPLPIPKRIVRGIVIVGLPIDVSVTAAGVGVDMAGPGSWLLSRAWLITDPTIGSVSDAMRTNKDQFSTWDVIEREGVEKIAQVGEAAQDVGEGAVRVGGALAEGAEQAARSPILVLTLVALIVAGVFLVTQT